MSRAERTANLLGVVLPFLGVLAAIVLLWNRAVDAADIAIMVVMYVLSAVGITVGFHRLLTHRAFQTYPWMERTLAVFGSLSVQGSVMDWVADHRKHHAHTDREGDPHSPHVGHGSGLAGLWHAHVGWLMETQGQADWKRYASELYEDPAMRKIGRRFPLLVALSLLVPTVAGYVLDGFTVRGAILGLIWGGLVRIFFVHHITWSVNSICHFFGSRRFDVDDQSTNVGWLAVLSLGESWHHNHHAFPRSAYHGLRWWEIDLSGLIISGMERVGLAWNVVRITPERQRARAVAGVSAQ
jgi:stearoyl-CoA desaturase (Delta-9 desaturase)